MINLENLIGARILWEGEKIDWLIKPSDKGTVARIIQWIRKHYQTTGGNK